jgi:glutamate/tyrosine decarboxylase-like PLP-dependent enzyme
LRQAVGSTICPEGIGGSAALRVFVDVLEPATRSQDDPMNLAYVPSAPTRASIAFDFVTSAANVFGGVWETGAGAIFAENEALGWLVELLGWPKTAGGCFVPGGTIGNLSALVAARETALFRRGSRPSGGWQLACTAEAHSSIRSAARVLDVTLVEVPGDDRGRLTGALLEPILRAHPDVFAVVATAGTTNAGLIDDLAGVADACAAHSVWMHVDGAYGAAAAALPEMAGVFAGLDQADSVSLDAHKWLYLPKACGVILVRRRRDLHDSFAHEENYLPHEQAEPHAVDVTLEYSRPFRALKLWLAFRAHGAEAFRRALRRNIRQARLLWDEIGRYDDLERLAPPELSIVPFRHVPPGIADADAHNLRLAQELQRDARVYVAPAVIDGAVYLRPCIVNFRTSDADVVAMVEIAREVGNRLAGD